MGERRLIIDHLKFSYEGLFNVEELHTLISSWFFEKGWDWYEKMNQELVTPEGRQIYIILEPWKSVSEYYKLMMHIKINLVNAREVEVEQNGEVLKLSQGVVRITFDGYVMSDRRGEWTTKPFYWFLGILSDRYFFKDHFARFETWLKSDVDDLYDRIKNYLNVFKYSYHA